MKGAGNSIERGRSEMEIRLCEEKDIEEVGKFYDKVVLYLCETINYPKWRYKSYPSEGDGRSAISLYGE